MGMTDKTPQRIAIADLQKKMKSSRKLLVVDVREPKELAEGGSIPGALHIPMAKLEKRMGDFSKDADLVFY
jgi:rhodanese-related sulfurtransferase